MMANKQTTREDKVALFHKAMSLDVNSEARVSLLETRKKLLLEETKEAIDAMAVLQVELMRGRKPTDEQWGHLLKELADVQYVLSGTVISFSKLPHELDTAFNRVHSSNLNKLDSNGKPVYSEDGKVLKGPNYKTPNLIDLLN